MNFQKNLKVVPLSSALDGKQTCLYFSASWCRPCRNFAPHLLHLYHSLRSSSSANPQFEVVFVSSDRDDLSFSTHFNSMPWLAVPFDPDLHSRIRQHCRVDRIPSLVPLINIGPDYVGEDAVQLVEDYGVDAFPFDGERRRELKALDDARRRGGVIGDLLRSGDRNFVVFRDGSKVPITQLIGKTVGLYFSARWSPPCRAFTASLAEAYLELARTETAEFEVVFVSTDRDEEEFAESLSGMPWPAIPYHDRTRNDLSRIFQVNVLPTLVVIGADQGELSTDGRAMVAAYGAAAYPFTEAREAELEAGLKREGEGLPKLVRDTRHAHTLRLDMIKAYVCDSCMGKGRFWAFSCADCDFDLHPACLVTSEESI
ncbi:putative nucleoredoxin 3 [Acorus gramineus]|uniref:protein-disulfide reductase n=1 Tax=Acorus gramineus TaxID=55184 RepID=A0AAV9AWZ7_ACOGR|nr:putative nucleoredoxin 3 [Acorus gramineus]